MYITNPAHHKRRIEESRGIPAKELSSWIFDHNDVQYWRRQQEGPDVVHLLSITGATREATTLLLCGIVSGSPGRSGASPLQFRLRESNRLCSRQLRQSPSCSRRTKVERGNQAAKGASISTAIEKNATTTSNGVSGRAGTAPLPRKRTGSLGQRSLRRPSLTNDLASGDGKLIKIAQKLGEWVKKLEETEHPRTRPERGLAAPRDEAKTAANTNAALEGQLRAANDKTAQLEADIRKRKIT